VGLEGIEGIVIRGEEREIFVKFWRKLGGKVFGERTLSEGIPGA